MFKKIIIAILAVTIGSIVGVLVLKFALFPQKTARKVISRISIPNTKSSITFKNKVARGIIISPVPEALKPKTNGIMTNIVKGVSAFEDPATRQKVYIIRNDAKVEVKKVYVRMPDGTHKNLTIYIPQ